MLEEHKKRIQNAFGQANSAGGALFCYLAFDRLRNCLMVHSLTNGISMEAAWRCADLVRVAISDGSGLSKISDSLEELVPTEGDPLSVQAQSALICLMAAAQMLEGTDDLGLEEVVNGVVDACDNYAYATALAVKNESSYEERYPLLERELAWQVSLVPMIGVNRISKDVVSDLIYQNRFYSIPAAI